MKNRLKCIQKAVFCGALSSVLLVTPVMAEAQVEKYSNTDFAMDTVISETLYTMGEDINASVGEKLREIETGLLSWTTGDSQIAEINNANGETVEVSEELAGYLTQILQLATDSDGAFDPTLGEVIRLWNIEGDDPHVPEQSELDKLLKNVDYKNIVLDGDKVTLKNGSTLDLGAVGKGIGCDVTAACLKEQKDVTGMILNLGGSSVMAYGEKPDQSPCKVAVTDPRDTEGEYVCAVTIKGGEFLSTSGDYEKYFMEDGKRYHHILNPEDGYPVWNGVTSVTVVCDNGLLADGLSTACFVLGIEDAQPLLEKYHADAAFMDDDHNVYLTSGMKERFELMKNTYTVKNIK